jgi:hypothetical protein
LVDATDNTKAVFSPEISNPEFTPGDPRTYGGGNATVGGIELILGKSPTTFTYELLNQVQTVVDQLEKIGCEKKVGVYLVNESGQYAGKTTGTANEIKPFPLHGFFVSDKQPGGWDNPDKHMGRFALRQGWSKGFTVIKPTDHDPTLDF